MFIYQILRGSIFSGIFSNSTLYEFKTGVALGVSKGVLLNEYFSIPLNIDRS